jgi:ligand-binding sensor domain-containing protein
MLFWYYTEKNKVMLNTRSPWIYLLISYLFIQKGFSIETSTRYFSKYLGINDGLPSRNISGITQDKKGIIWIGSRDMGLIRFDGHKFSTRFEDASIPVINDNNEIFDIITSKNGNLMIAGSDGIVIFNPNSGYKKTIYKNQKISALFKDYKGNIWFSIFNKLFYSKDENLNDMKLMATHVTEISSIMEDPQKRIWYIDIDGRCNKLKSRINEDLRGGFFLEKNGIINWFQQIINLKGELLGMNFFNVNNIRIPVKFSASDQFSYGFPDKGIPIFDLIKSSGFPTREFMKFGKGEIKYFKDKLNTIWIGTGYGIILLKEKSVQFNSLKELDGKSVRGMLERDNGNIIIATYAGLYEWDRKSEKINGLPNSYSTLNICFKPIHIQGNRLFTTLENYNAFDILEIKKNKFINNQNLILSSSGLGFRGAYYDKSRNMIYAGNTRVYQINPSNMEIKALPFENTEKELQLFDFLQRDSSSFFIGTDKGLLIFDIHKGWIPEPLSVNKIQSNIKVRINHIYKNTNGQLWLSTNQICIILFDYKKNKILSRLTMKDGLPSNEIYAIYSMDGGKNLWLSTANGLSTVNIKNKTIQNFNTNDGLIGNEFNTISHLKSKDGLLLFGGTEGVTYFNPSEIKSAFSIKPTPFISDINVYDSKEGKDISLSNSYPITLKWYHSPLRIHLGGDDYFDFKNQNFRYKLLRYDERWQYINNQNPITYNKLPQGEYTLQIQIRSNSSGWNGQVKTLQIIQKPIWYKQTYVIILFLTLLFFILYLLVSNKLNQLQKEHNVRLEIAEDLHDRMGSMIFSINYSANKLLANKQEINENIKYELNRITVECQQINLAISDIIWAIDLGKQKFKDLIIRFQDFSDRYLLEKGIKVTYHISEMIPSEKILSLTVRHQLMMIFTEAIQNILKHAPDSKVIININYEKSHLTLEVINSFHTRNMTSFSSGHGMTIMQKRAKRMEANIHFDNDAHQFLITCRVKV